MRRGSVRVAAFWALLILGTFLMSPTLFAHPLPPHARRAFIATQRQLLFRCRGTDWCGGWANRFNGMVSAYIMAVASGRRLRIAVTRPLPVETWLSEPASNASIGGVFVQPEELRGLESHSRSATAVWINRHIAVGEVHRLLSPTGASLQAVVAVRTNLNLYQTLSAAFPTTVGAVPWDEWVRRFFRLYVKPRMRVERLRRQLFADVGERFLLCAQLRRSDNATAEVPSEVQRRLQEVDNWVEREAARAAGASRAPVALLVLSNDAAVVHRYRSSPSGRFHVVSVPGTNSHLEDFETRGTLSPTVVAAAAEVPDDSTRLELPSVAHTRAFDFVAAQSKSLADFFAVSRCDSALVDDNSEFVSLALALNTRHPRRAVLSRPQQLPQ